MNDVAEMQTVPTDAWDTSLAHIVADMAGKPLNVHKVLANHPELLNAWWSFRQHIVAGGALGKRNAELVILRTAVHANCWYEWASHVERGLQSDLSMDEIDRVMGGPVHADWSESDSVLLRAVDELHIRGVLAPEIVEMLERHFGPKAVLDMIAIRATYVMLGDILNTWETELDQHVSNALPDSVTREGFEGES